MLQLQRIIQQFIMYRLKGQTCDKNYQLYFIIVRLSFKSYIFTISFSSFKSNQEILELEIIFENVTNIRKVKRLPIHHLLSLKFI
ncbi:hypothetical protein pb186bvf_003087 [Paramecium bursaria]